MLVSAAIEPYRKSYGNAWRTSATAPGSCGSDRSTASPRYTCVPGVQAYAVSGSRTTSSRAATTRPARRIAGRPIQPDRRSDAQAPALAANRFAKVAKLVLNESIDAVARLADRLAHLALDALGRDLVDEPTAMLARPSRARRARRHRPAPRPLGAPEHGCDRPSARGASAEKQGGRRADRRADEGRGEQVVLGITPNLAFAGGLADAWLPLRAGRDRCTHRRSPPASDPERRACRPPHPRCEARQLRCARRAPSTPSR